jgi:hypothetical protein
MAGPVNLADPDVEPTDEELEELMRLAFADVKRSHDESLARLRAEIARLRDEALRALEQRKRA